MPAWWSFLAVSLLTVGTVLVLARRSQDVIDQYAPDAHSDATGISIPSEAAGLSVRRETGQALSLPQPTSDDRRPGLTPGLLLANVTLSQGLVALVVALAAWYCEIPGDALGITAAVDPRAVGVGVAFGTVLWVGNELSTTVADAVGASYDERVRRLLAPASAGGWVALLTVVLPLIAVSEELLFRAALVGVPAAGLGLDPWALAVASSLAFALGHGAQGRVGVAVTGTLGFVLAAGYVVTGSLLVVVTAHYVLNAVEFLVHERFEVGVLASEE